MVARQFEFGLLFKLVEKSANALGIAFEPASPAFIFKSAIVTDAGEIVPVVSHIVVDKNPVVPESLPVEQLVPYLH